ncbi:hypothetical protein [Paenibacillus harenae]|uniref:hypothetical protein n=1 Tax=Paenibacillus harenae TaxID=306543 RepID=UPI00278DB36B|nr:hypothetical protein [Paenibacillus harenae]MDQ0062045.1 hypothetical protein [Paenibacillus harenae]
MQQKIEVLLFKLKTIIEKTVNLDLNDHFSDDLLIEYQEEKNRLCDSIDQIIREEHNGQYAYSQSEMTLLQACSQAEQLLNGRISDMRQFISKEISQLSAGRKARNFYAGDAYNQSGFFIDHQN